MSRAASHSVKQSAAQPVTYGRGPDYVLIATTAVLVVIGLIAVYSASFAVGYAEYGDSNYFIRRQAVWAAIGVGGLLTAMAIDYRMLMRLSPLLMLLALGGLALALLPGISVEQNGASRWIGVGSFTAQPSEFAKLAVLIYIAAWLAAKGTAVRDFALGVVPFAAMVGLVCALVVLEPDLGTTILIAFIAGTLFFVSGARVLHVLTLVGSVVGFTATLILVGGYGMNRLLSFTSAEADPQGAGFQTLQLLVAFGSGGLTGLGLGVSRQKFFYVPGSHTDGVLAIIGEELGFIGVTVVLLLFVVLLWRGLLIARRAADPFGSLLAMGVLAWLSCQLLLNVGGVTRLIPLTGIPLPFLSYGGSSLAVTLTAVGVLLSVSRRAALGEPEQAAPTRGVLRAPAARAAAGGGR